MSADCHMSEQPMAPKLDATGGPAVSLSQALSSGANALVLTGRNGMIRRVASPVSRDICPITRDLPGRHITAPFVDDERPLVEGLLRKMDGAGFFAIGSIPVWLHGVRETLAYMTVSTLSCASADNFLIVWRFSPTQQHGFPGLDERERLLLQRIEVLEARAETQRRAAEQARKALNLMVENNRSLTRALRSGRELQDQHAAVLRRTIADKDQMVKHLRDVNDAMNEARRIAEDAHQRLAFMADLSLVLSESLDLGSTLQHLAERLVPDVVDCCIIDLVHGETDTLRQTAVACRDAAMRERIGRFSECAYLTADPSHPLRRVMERGETVVLNDTHESRGYPHIETPSLPDQPEESGISACIVAPLRSRDRTLGTLTLASSNPAHRFGPRDVQFARDFALRAAQALDNALLFQRVEEASKVRERYLSMASHELRSPLTIVTGFGSLLLRNLESPEPDLTKLTAIGHELRAGLERLEMLTDNLLASASLEGQPDEIPRRPVDLVQLTTHAIERELLTRDPQERSRISFDGPESLVGEWNGESVDRAITNVVSNALKYSQGDEPVEVTVERVDEWALVHVRDRGIGMTDAEVEELFTPFMRGSNARATAAGTGLGLYITNQIIERHGGRILVESKPGQGSTFSLWLPIEASSSTSD